MSNSYYNHSWNQVRDVIMDMLVGRKVKREEIDGKVSKAILNEVVGANDLCMSPFSSYSETPVGVDIRFSGSRCSNIVGVELIGPASKCVTQGWF